MAGIGFVLRKLYRKGDISSMMQAYMHATLASSGPWLLTIITIALLFLLNQYIIHYRDIESFRLVIMYNFSFSLVFTAPFSIIATRYLSDSIYRQSLRESAGLMMGMLIVQMLVLAPFSILFYFGYAILDPLLALHAVINFLLISSIWLVSVFISAIKYYTPITWSFLGGMTIALFSGSLLGETYGAIGMLIGFDVGLVCILSSLIAVVLSEYPIHFEKPFGFLSYFRSHWEIALGGLFYGMGLWVDKWVMWCSPEAIWFPSRLVMYPYYDSAMFIAMLSIIPAMASFMLSQETTFYEKYLVFYRSIQQNKNYKAIDHNHNALMQCFFYNGRNLLILQAGICFMAIILAPKLFDLIGMKHIQLGIFRYGVLGSCFQVLTVFLVVILSYFDARRETLYIQGLFFVTNALFSYCSMKLGFAFFGSGYFFSTVVTFFVAAVLTERNINRLPYLAFIKQNSLLAR